MFTTSNPTLKSDTFSRYGYASGAESRMSIEGAVNKSLALFAILVFSAVGGAYLTLTIPPLAILLLGGGAIIGFILSMVISFKPDLAPVLSPVYAIAEGVAVGAISLLYGRMQSGIVFNAVVLTLSILGGMLILYRAGILRATPLFTKVVMFGVFGLMATYVIDLLMSFFGAQIPMIHQATPLGIVFSLVACGVASLTFVLDFDFIERGAHTGAPKYMEWYAGFSLLVSLVWLYLEILRLLSKLRSSNN